MNMATPEDGDTLANTQGWLYPFSSQEKAVGNSVTLAGATVFATSLPPAATIDPNTCQGNLGTARIYQLTYCNAEASADLNQDGNLDPYLEVPGGGLLPPPVPFLISVSTGEAGGGSTTKAGVILGTHIINVETTGGGKPSQRTFWYKEIDD
jgi:hypothetical protein